MYRASILTLAISLGALAQSGPQLSFPHLNGDRSTVGARAAAVTLDDPVSRYKDRREAATAALQEAFKSATQHPPNRPRAMSLLLTSLTRDPNFGEALYDMAVVCELEQSWQDALSFYKQVQQADAQPALMASAAEQIVRVQEIATLERTTAGQRQRQYDIQLLAAVARINDPAVGLDDAGKLLKLDPSRWEGAALAGVLQAALGRFSESSNSLEQAVGLAPAAKRPQLQSAAEAARREASFLDSVRQADEAWDKQQYETAAKSFTTAWQDDPSDTKVAMQAATGFLMADQIPPAVTILSQLRASDGEAGPKAAAMLKELSAVSEDARRASASAPASAAPQPVSARGADRIRTLVGELTTPQIQLASTPAPALIDDKTQIVPVKDDDLTNARADLMLLSTQSVFAMYRERAAAQAPPPGAPAPPDSASPSAPAMPVAAPQPGMPLPLPPPPSALPAQTPAPESARPTPLQQRQSPQLPPAPPTRAQPSSAALPKGSERMVDVSTSPPGSLVVFDNNPSLNCVTPCQISLTPGRHTLVATLAGHRQEQRILQVEEKKPTSLAVEMTAKQGFLTVESKIAGSPVFVNGKTTGRVTPASLTLDEGEYEIGVEIGGALKTQHVTVKDGGLMKVSIE